MNDWITCKAIDDKSLYDLYFADLNRPHTIARSCDGVWLADGYKQTTISQVSELCQKYKAVIIKPSVGSSGGHGIAFWKEGDGGIKELLGQYNNCVVQELIIQHEELAEIHPESINTIRIMSMILDGEVHLLSAILRMGVGKAKVDNVSSGGVACGIDKDGKLKQTSWNAKGQNWNGHPEGLSLQGKRVPSYKECCDVVRMVAPRFARFSKLVSWDFAIDQNGTPILIEANLYGGELDFHQMCNGPIFGDEETTKRMIKRFVNKR